MSIFNGNNRKKVSISSMILFTILGIVIRSVYIFSMNYPFVKEMNYDKNLGQAKYYINDGEYVLKYCNASFFHAEYFASVCCEEDMKWYMDENGKMFTEGMQVTLFIWPKGEYGVEFYRMEDGEEIFEQVMIDRFLHCLSELENDEQKLYIEALIEDNRDIILNYFEEAEKYWNLERRLQK